MICQIEDKCSEEKLTWVRGLWRAGEEGSILYQVVIKGFNDQGVFEYRPEESKGGSHVDILEKIVGLQAEGTKSVKFLRHKYGCHNVRNSKKASVAEPKGLDGRVVGDRAREAVKGRVT